MSKRGHVHRDQELALQHGFLGDTTLPTTGEQPGYPPDSVRQVDCCVYIHIKFAGLDGAGGVVLLGEVGRDGHLHSGGPQLSPPCLLPTLPLDMMLMTYEKQRWLLFISGLLCAGRPADTRHLIH